MLDKEVVRKLDAVARTVKELLPDINGNVQINLARDPKMKPKVNVNLADVTAAK